MWGAVDIPHINEFLFVCLLVFLSFSESYLSLKLCFAPNIKIDQASGWRDLMDLPRHPMSRDFKSFDIIFNVLAQ